ncbi:hypothetical protein LEMLEM_LOCUS150, partial [Lemmus lemmus]
MVSGEPSPRVFRAPRLPIKLAVLFMTSASPRVNYCGPLVPRSALLPPIIRLCVMLMRKASVEESNMPRLIENNVRGKGPPGVP